MILTKELLIKINNKDINYYRKMGYIFEGSGCLINISVNHLSKGSHRKIIAKCDICGYEESVEYRYYLDRIKNNNLYCCSNKCARIKTDKTNLEKYGSISPTQNKEILKKRENTYLRKYGQKTNLMCDETKNKIKKSCLKKFGCENPSQSEEIKKKKELSCLKNYGVKNPQQNINIFEKTKKTSYKIKTYRNLRYQGSYELDFLVNFYDKVKIEKGKSIDYLHDGKIKKYHSDFFLPDYNLIIEIKSDYTYNYDICKNENKKFGAIKKGYNFLFVINKNYEDLLTFL